MDTLQEWDFDKYSQSAAKKALNHNIKHVMKEGGRAGKALMINTDKLISTVQILGTAGGAAKAVQAISVTTGVMSALFLALDVFFLAKDSHELRKGAKTKFANKIRDVCKELQDGLLELNKVKTQLQKTMDGIEVEEYEEIEEVEVEVDDDLASDPQKLAELEQELDLLEEKLDKKMEADVKYNEMEKERKGKTAKGMQKEENNKENEEVKEINRETLKTKDDKEHKLDLEITHEEIEHKNEKVNLAKDEVVKDLSQKERNIDETENAFAAKGKQQSRNETDKKSCLKNNTNMKEKEKMKTKEHVKCAQSESKQEQHGRAHSKRESDDAEREIKTNKEVEHGSMKSKHKMRDIDNKRQHSEKMEDRRKVEDRHAMDRRAEMPKKSEVTKKRGTYREDDSREIPHQRQRRRVHREQESVSPREEYKRHDDVSTAAGHEELVDTRVVKSGSGSTRKQCESTRDKEKVKGRKSRDEERDKERRHSHRRSRGQSSMLLEDGLYI